MGGSSYECASKAEASNKKPVTSIKETMDKEVSSKVARDQALSADNQIRQQQELQRQQQQLQQYQLQQQYQQNKK